VVCFNVARVFKFPVLKMCKISEYRKDVFGCYCAFLILNTNLSVQMFYMHVLGYKTVYIKLSNERQQSRNCYLHLLSMIIQWRKSSDIT
jgi:hypothetical protein